MGEKLKKYLKNEFQLEMFTLKHDHFSDFYLSCWQRNRSSLPLLFIRSLIFIGCVGTWITSMIISVPRIAISLWFIFMTHWGVMFNTMTSAFAVVISLVALIKKPSDSYSGLPWYAKVYWILINTSSTMALFITLFYWILLTDLSEDYGMDPVLDVFIHGINSVLMVALLLVARHPMRLLHFYYPLILGIIYIVFSIIFHFAGGTSPFGESWIYPMLDWAEPGETMLLVFGSAVMYVVIHAFLVGLTVARDALTKRFRDSTVLSISDDRYY